MSDLRELYQEVIIGHAKSPHNFRKPADANRTVEGYNPLCGDRFTVYLKVEDDLVKDAAFEGAGCAISTASASLMTDAVRNKSVAEAEQLAAAFGELITGSPDDMPDTERLGKLAVFAGVCEFPSRVKCAGLAWHSLRSALTGSDDVVSTE
jgi:nitrogen fixation protein NifU and related proteins